MYEAYSVFMALSPGSIPTNGFMREMQVARQGVTTSNTGYLTLLSLRPGSTPYVVGTAPQRQVNQSSPEHVLACFADIMAIFAASQEANSSNSPTGNTTTTRSSSCSCPSDTSLRTFGCIACCPHGFNSSSHMVLHPSDFEVVVQNGWSELHPCANTGSYYASSSASPCMPATLALTYAPRTFSEVFTVMTIVQAGSKYLASL